MATCSCQHLAVAVHQRRGVIYAHSRSAKVSACAEVVVVVRHRLAPVRVGLLELRDCRVDFAALCQFEPALIGKIVLAHGVAVDQELVFGVWRVEILQVDNVSCSESDLTDTVSPD